MAEKFLMRFNNKHNIFLAAAIISFLWCPTEDSFTQVKEQLLHFYYLDWLATCQPVFKVYA